MGLTAYNYTIIASFQTDIEDVYHYFYLMDTLCLHTPLILLSALQTECMPDIKSVSICIFITNHKSNFSTFPAIIYRVSFLTIFTALFSALSLMVLSVKSAHFINLFFFSTSNDFTDAYMPFLMCRAVLMYHLQFYLDRQAGSPGARSRCGSVGCT